MHPKSYHYPALLVEPMTYLNVADQGDLKGGRLLVFRDEHGDQVTFRLSDKAAETLLKVLEVGPT